MNYTLHFPENYVKPPLPGRDEWISALRSGEYSQCQDKLCDGYGYCCFGVLSKVQGRIRFDLDWRDGSCSIAIDNDNPLYPHLKCDFSHLGNGSFPKGVMIDLEGEVEIASLAECNDQGLTFNQISDIIEAVWDHAPKNW